MSRDRELLEQIVKAWTVPGRAPSYHKRTQRDLRDHWPTLYNIIQESVVHVTTTTPLDAIADPSAEAEVRSFLMDLEKEELNAYIKSLEADIARQNNTRIGRFMSRVSTILVYGSGVVMVTFILGLLIAVIGFVADVIGKL